MIYLLLLTASLDGDIREYPLKQYNKENECISIRNEMRQEFLNKNLKHFKVVVSCKGIR